MYALCKAALPQNYFMRFVNVNPMASTHNGNSTNNVYSNVSLQDKDLQFASKDGEVAVGQFNQVVATGTVCPTPSLTSAFHNLSVMITSKNIQVAKVLISCAQANASQLNDCWHLVLNCVQHLVWILDMRPTIQGGFMIDGESSNESGNASGSSTALMTDSAPTPTSASTSPMVSSNVVLTTAIRTEVRTIGLMLNRLFESTNQLDDVSLHHIIAALCKLSSEIMLIPQHLIREPSFFAVAKLQQTAMANIERIEVLWKPITAHLIEVYL
ncbi:unnamed protein product [Anisakis simplex]|uniref:Monensin-resistant homolog 2 (inferred by orthology to a C. elegans protein) n=1 Tax=Anisakis simplex TaxID=6269 RepID=A0A0M3J9S5_ANISI|nr:unnamed protein product [Anisakis simplex]